MHSGMRRALFIPLLASILLSACGAGTPVTTPQLVNVYATAATQPWLADLYACAEQESVVIRLADSPSAAEILLRVGQPEDLSTPAYEIDREDILIVTNRESPVQNLSAEEARALFAGRGAEGVDIWIFAPAEDVQQIFEREIMQGTPITSLARLAATPQQMSDTLNSEKNAVGILPRHWKAGTVRDVLALPNVPVLAILKSDPQGAAKDLLTCLQK